MALKLAFMGLGGMGGGMASRLLDSGFDVALYNRTRSTAESVAADAGGTVADTPAEAAADADVVLLSLSNHQVVESVLFGQDGAVPHLRPGGYVVDMSTVPTDFPAALAARVAQTGHHAMDACVLGNPFHARSGDLRVMVGGEEEDVAALREILSAIGKQVTRLGGHGAGATMKLIFNVLMGSQMPALAEAVVLGERAGLPRDTVLELLSEGGYTSPVMAFRCGIMGRRQFDLAAFKLQLMRKDMLLVLDTAHELGVPMPVAESAYSVLTAAMQQGLGELDVAAVLAHQERMSGLEGYAWPGPGGEAS